MAGEMVRWDYRVLQYIQGGLQVWTEGRALPFGALAHKDYIPFLTEATQRNCAVCQR